MREIIGETPFAEATTEGRGSIEVQAREQMQATLDAYGAGILVNQVQLQKVDPPGEVIDAFRDVQRAQADRERAQNEAETFANDILPRARGEAERLVQEAQAYRQEVVADAQGDAQRFLAVYNDYAKAPDVTTRRIYLETMEQVLRDMNKVVIDKPAGGSGRRALSAAAGARAARARAAGHGTGGRRERVETRSEPQPPDRNRSRRRRSGAAGDERAVHRASDAAGAGPAVRQPQADHHRARAAHEDPVHPERDLHRSPRARLRRDLGGDHPRRSEAARGRCVRALSDRRSAALLSVGGQRGGVPRPHQHHPGRFVA